MTGELRFPLFSGFLVQLAQLAQHLKAEQVEQHDEQLRLVIEFFSVLENTVIDSGAFTHALSCVFSRLNTLVYGRDGLVRKAGRMAESMFSTSRPPVALEKAASGFQSHSGAETMTTVKITPTPTLGNTSPLARQQAIENALSLALYHARHGNIAAATGRAIRAASMLKQACTESITSGRA